MKFGIFYELQLPRPWLAGGELQLYQNALDQVELADRLGYDYAWEVEHHFLEEYSHSPAPEVFLGAASPAHQAHPPLPRHHAIDDDPPGALRRAHRRARSGSRTAGSSSAPARSASITELQPFGVAFDEKRAIWEEAIRAIIPMFKDGGCEHHGKYFDMPLRNVVPKPMQKPHPPLWVRLLAAGNDRDGRAPRPRRARLPVPLGRCGACLGARLLQRLHQAAGKALRLRHQPEPRADQLFHVRGNRRGGAPPRRRHPVLPVRAALLRPAAPTASGPTPARSICGTNTRSGSAPTPRRCSARCPAASSARRRRCGANCAGSRPRTSTRSFC